jgi:hypothetical protein
VAEHLKMFRHVGFFRFRWRSPVASRRPQGVDMTAIMKTREERQEELKRIAATPNGRDKLYSILTRNFIRFEKLPIGTLMIEAILGHEYSVMRGLSK